MWKLLTTINKNLFIAIPVMLLFGFACGVLFEPASLRHAIVPLTFLMVYPMMVTLKLRKVFQRGDDKAQWLAQAINFGIIPFAVLFIGRLFFPNEPYLALGLLLAGLVPTSGMTISWTGFAKGNVEAAVKMTVIGLVLGSLATPVYVKLLMGADIDMDLALAINAFGTQGANAALVIALAYVVQVQSAAWYVKFTDRIFGPTLTVATPAMAPLSAGATVAVYSLDRQASEP